MIKKKFTGSARRARNIIWNAAGSYDFEPPFMAFFPNGVPDHYFNMVVGLAHKWLDLGRIWDFFEAYGSDRRADEELARLAAAREESGERQSVVKKEEPPEAPAFEERALDKEGKSFTDLYKEKKEVFITADAAYEFFRAFFERAVDGVYGTYLYDQYASLFVELSAGLEERYESAEGADRLAVRNALRFSAVCMKLCLSTARVPLAVQREVEEEIALVKAAEFVGERGGRVRDYTVYAALSKKAETPWGAAALLRAYLENNYFRPDEEESYEALWIVLEVLFNSPIAEQNYREVVKYLKAFDGETKALSLKEIWEKGKGKERPFENPVLREEIVRQAATSLDRPPWRDPSEIKKSSPRVWFLPPAASLPERVFRELHRWVVPPRTEHVLYVLGVETGLNAAEASLLDGLREEVKGCLGFSERAAAAAALLKGPEKVLPAASYIRSAVYSAESPEEFEEERDWPHIEAVRVEKEAEYYRALAALIRELNELYTELDLYHIMASYKKTPLTADHLLEAEQILLELADMSRSEPGEGAERDLMTGRRFLTLLSTGGKNSRPWGREFSLGLEYNFQSRSAVGLKAPRLVEISFPEEEGKNEYFGVRYQMFEKKERLEEVK